MIHFYQPGDMVQHRMTKEPFMILHQGVNKRVKALFDKHYPAYTCRGGDSTVLISLYEHELEPYIPHGAHTASGQEQRR